MDLMKNQEQIASKLIKLANEKHNLSFDPYWIDLNTLINYARFIGYAEGYKDGKDFKNKS
jgi:hypothetical protein